MVPIKKSVVILAARGVAIPWLKYSAKLNDKGEISICCILKYQGTKMPAIEEAK